MNTATEIQLCDLVIALVNFVDLLAVALPVAGLLTCGLIMTSRHINRPPQHAGPTRKAAPSRIPKARLSQPKPDTALIAAA